MENKKAETALGGLTKSLHRRWPSCHPEAVLRPWLWAQPGS